MAAATTEVHVVKYASDGTTVLKETTVDYQWMEDNLDIYGDGETEYYHQGPIFEDEWLAVHPGETYDFWDENETVNYLGKNKGCPMGTDIKDLCNLVGS